MNYYNEFDPFAAAWLRNLIADGLIPPGDVDERDMRTIASDELRGYTQCHFFAGIGGWSYALALAGWPSDVPVWTGSPPCQPFSSAGKQTGKDDERHLWPQFYSLIRKCRPPVIFGEQVASAIRHGWFDDLRFDLEAEGYATAMAVLPACSVGAPHKRDRLYYVANAERYKQSREESRSGAARRVGREQQPFPWNTPWQSALSRFRVVGDGLPRSVATTDAARNAIVPQVAAEVIKAFMAY